MTTNINDLITYSVTDAALAEMRSKFLGLRVLNATDEEGYAQCKEARAVVRRTRLEVEERRKELKAESLSFGRAVDAEAKRITEKIEEVEGHLVSQLKIVDDEKKRREEEAARKALERIDLRQRKMAEVGAPLSHTEAATLSDEDFSARLESATAEFKAAAIAREEERKRLAELEKERAKQAAKIRAQEEETLKLREELLAKERAAAAEAEEKRRAAEALRLEAERKLEDERRRIAAEAAEVERKAAEEAERKRKAEAEAARKVADTKLFKEIKASFPTLESAWIEIARLRKLMNN